MKKIVLALVFVAFALSVFATGQGSDVAYFNGQKWYLMGRPVERDSVLYYSLLKYLPDHRSQSTANWEGFVGYWSVKKGYLVLDSIMVQLVVDGKYVDTRIQNNVMRKVFAKYYYKNKAIVALWVSGSIRLAQGEMIYYVHDAWNRNYETEMYLNLEKGKVTGQKTYHNRIVKEGYHLGYDSVAESIREGYVKYLRSKYHQLDTMEGKIYFRVSHFEVDTLGNLLNVSVEQLKSPFVHFPEFSNLEQSFKQYLMGLRPWKVYLINGKYGVFTGQWVIPILLER
ncbi:MAG: hypothetical protein J5826_09235 [Bacteroidales bacterium]|nr:hypothetical protein [Bacteroidales bacterium]MBR5027674.1 hypothetical protein [Bacteroidales bacterium]